MTILDCSPSVRSSVCGLTNIRRRESGVVCEYEAPRVRAEGDSKARRHAGSNWKVQEHCYLRLGAERDMAWEIILKATAKKRRYRRIHRLIDRARYELFTAG
jgi:hypothetical protein